MARFVSTTPGWGKPGDRKRTDQAIRRWIKAQLTQGLGGGTPASIGFVLTQSNPASFGAQMATDAPEVIYSLGNLYYSGGVRVLQATGRGNPAKTVSSHRPAPSMSPSKERCSHGERCCRNDPDARAHCCSPECRSKRLSQPGPANLI